MDPYATTLTPNQQGALQQDVQFGQINHLTQGQDIKFPDTASPGQESQFLMMFLMKLVAMSYNLPYSFALDAHELGGVSSRLESEQAKAEFERGRRVLIPLANRLKNAALMDAVAKGVFTMEEAPLITRGRWSFRAHPQPDIGKEASAQRDLWQNGLANPIKYWTDAGEDPEAVAFDFARWYVIKDKIAKAHGVPAVEIFGTGPQMPTYNSKAEKVTGSLNEDGTVNEAVSEVDKKEETPVKE
jgi:capsid protein